MVQEAERGAFSWREIITQAESWAGALTAAIAARAEVGELFGDGGRVLFIGCGSAHYLAQFVAQGCGLLLTEWTAYDVCSEYKTGTIADLMPTSSVPDKQITQILP